MTPEELQTKFAGMFPEAERLTPGVKGYLTMKVPTAAGLLPIVAWLKGNLGFEYLDMVTATDLKGPADLRGFVPDPNFNYFKGEGSKTEYDSPPAQAPSFHYKDAFEIVYCLSNLQERIKIFLKLGTPRDDAKVPSLVPLFPAADWQEREVYDLLGVRFQGHPNLTKILTPEFIGGHPLRKDYLHVPDKYD